MIKVEWVYWLCGFFFLAVAAFTATDRTNPKRLGSAAFWGLLGLSFGYSTFVVAKSAPPWPVGVAVLAMVVLVGTGQLRKGDAESPDSEEQVAGADRFGSWLFAPALIVPVVAVLFAVVLIKVHPGGKPLLEKGSETLIGLGAGAVIAVVVALVMLRPRSPLTPVREGGRLLQAIGWAALLPQMLATLGSLFTTAGVGKAVGTLSSHLIPGGSLIGGVVAYCLGMALFTVVMGNAFAAFPIMTAAIGWPVLIQEFHGNPAAVFAIGMLAGFCGTLCTPMAANFNVVPAALLDMKDRYGVVKTQLPTAIPLLGVNIGLMYFAAF